MSGVLALVFALVAAGLAALALSGGATARALAERGRDAVATVVAKRIDTQERYVDGEWETEIRYLVTYAFDALLADGTFAPLQAERGAPEVRYEALSPGQEVAVRYLPEDPAVADFSEGATAQRAGFLGWAAGGMLAVALLLAALAVRGARRLLRLDRSGLWTTGVVEAVQRANERTIFTLRYADAGGVERRARAHAVSGAAWEAIEAGAALPLVYDPRDPRNVAVVEPAATRTGLPEPA